MTRSQTLQIRLSEVRQRLNEISQLEGEALTDEIRTEADTLTAEFRDKETQYRAAVVAEEEQRTQDAAELETGEAPESRERRELRQKASVGRYLAAAMRGQPLDGAELELAQAAGVEDRGIPLELWTPPRRPAEERALTPAPGTTGINLDLLRPAVFAPSIADRLMVDMPTVMSGTFASGTISTSTTADAEPKGDAVPETAAAFTVTTTTPHRVGASLLLSIEDVAAVGQENFESVLRENISLALSDELDDQLINGDGDNTSPANNLSGFFARLTDPSAPAAGVASFDTFVGVAADGIDGLWASMMDQVSIVCGVDTYRLSAKTFRDEASADLGDISFADYAAEHLAGWWTNKRMPAAASNVQQAILCRKGREAMRTAVAPHWGFLAIDDIYSLANKGQRRFTVSVLVGDLILVQPDAYAQVSFRVST